MRSEVEREERPGFIAPQIQDNPLGWGPVGIPEQFRNLPFQPFNKADKIGKVADWTGSLAYQDRRFQTRYTQQYSSGPVGTQYGYYHDEDDSSFQLVDTSRPQKTAMQRANRLKQIQYNRKLLQKERERRKEAGYYNANNKQSRSLTKERQKQMKQYARRGFGQRRWDNRGGGRWGDQKGQKTRQPSIQTRPDWKVLEELDFARLHKLRLGEVPQGQDISGEQYGTLEFYDKSFDRVTTRSERPLARIPRVYYTVTTTEDPVIQKLAKKNEGNVFTTDVLLSTLMCATRSVYSWDIVAIRIGDKLFLDKRDKSELDYVTVSETASEPPADDGNSLNLPRNLALEATFINRNFSQQILLKSDLCHNFPNPTIPFVEEGQDPKEVASLAYRYRRWNLGPGTDGKDIVVVCRTEHDGVTVGSGGKKEFLTVKAFNEWDSKYSGGVEWRSKLDNQKGAVVATELQNNSCKLAKWTVQALLAGSDQMKFGFVSRLHSRDSSRHVILCTCQYKPIEMANSISLNLENVWGILRCVIDLCMQQPAGKYLFMKDPNKGVVRMYGLPPGTFDTDEEDSEEDTEEEEDEEEEDQVSKADEK